jgi:hypothetical protein
VGGKIILEKREIQIKVKKDQWKRRRRVTDEDTK